MSIVTLQSFLSSAGYNPGMIDGAYGPKTLAALMGYVARSQPTSLMRQVATSLVPAMISKDITTPLRICHFLGQCCVETANWIAMTEYGGASYFAKYDGRADLGNSEPGDGYAYRGRGLVMLTGRTNYKHFGAVIGIDLINNPDQAAKPDTAARIAVAYWGEKHVNAKADTDNVESVTRAINGGINGLADRMVRTGRAKTAWGL